MHIMTLVNLKEKTGRTYENLGGTPMHFNIAINHLEDGEVSQENLNHVANVMLRHKRQQGSEENIAMYISEAILQKKFHADLVTALGKVLKKHGSSSE